MKVKIENIDPIDGGADFTRLNSEFVTTQDLALTNKGIKSFTVSSVDFHYDSSSVRNQDSRYLIRILKAQLKIANVVVPKVVLNNAKFTPSCGEFIIVEMS